MLKIWAIDRSVENYDVPCFRCVPRGIADDVETRCCVAGYRSARTAFSVNDYSDVGVGKVGKRDVVLRDIRVPQWRGILATPVRG